MAEKAVSGEEASDPVTNAADEKADAGPKASRERLEPLAYQAPDPKLPREKRVGSDGEEAEDLASGEGEEDTGVPAYDPPRALQEVLDKEASSVRTSQDSGLQLAKRQSTLRGRDQQSRQDALQSQLSAKGKAGGFEARQGFADELMWLNFETKMRNTIRELIQPVVEMSQRDREGMLILEGSGHLSIERLERLEEAVFNKSSNEKRTLFEQMQDQIKANEVHMKERCKWMGDVIEAKIAGIDGTMFLHNQSIERCLVVSAQVQGLQEEQEKLTQFVRNYNSAVNNQIKETRNIMAEATASLQKQISLHTETLANLKPRIAKNEGDIGAANKRAEKQGVKLETAFARIDKLQLEKVPHVEDAANRHALQRHMRKIDASHDTLKDQ